MTPPPPSPHNNQQLFSDYYLDRKLPERADWQILTESATAVRDQIAALVAGYTPSDNEAQVEHDLVRPVLAALGHAFEVQPALKTPDGTKRPDYVFYRSPAARDANKNKTLTDALLRAGGLAVGDAKYWDRPLDVALHGSKSGVSDPSNKNPSFQIAFYIQHSGVDWGILTNGRKWRLYHKETAHKLNRFYEVDLPALLNDPVAFCYFYAFFRRDAFEPGPLGVDELLRESSDYARGISASLKKQVYDALKHLAQGFLDYAPNGLSAEDPATRRTIYNSSLILLYRLLFVLYAEARELLPVRTSADYRDSYSLAAIKRQVADDRDHHRHLLPTSALLWPRLRELFHIIDQGSPPLQVTTYNGGLFDANRHPFLEHHTVGDARLQHALDLLARVEDLVSGERVFVDYRDLSERHLGTIYEGLLEFQLARLPQAEGDWTIALVNDKGERKATGSYYTPDTIVKYIVEQTVGPILREAVAGKTSDAEKIAAVLGVNVLDPAMGSGHFLVEATEYIARFLVDLAVSSDGEENREPDITYWKRRVVQSCVYGVDLNPLAVELAKLSLWLSTLASNRPLSFLDHHLRTGNALVGARLDELARVRAGETKRTRKTATARESVEAAGQLTLLADDAFRQSMSLAVGNLWLIEANDARNVADVKQQEALYQAARAAFTRKWARLADLTTATHFGVAIAPGLWKPLADFALGRVLTAPPRFAQWLAEAEEIARARHFFHWELEFPEVFFDQHGRPLGEAAGFDAVVGNPPYVRQELLAPFKPFLKETFAAYHSVADLYLYFFEQGLRLLQRGGRMAFISSGTFARANFAQSFRAVLPTLGALESIIDFGENQPFAGAEMVRPSIVVLRRGAQEDGPFRSLFLSGKVPESLADAVAEQGVDLDANALSQPEWSFQSSVGTLLLAKLQSAGRKLVDVVDGKILYGVKTGFNKAFIIDTPTRNRLVKEDLTCASLIKPVLQGEDLRPWYQEDEGRWLIFTRRGTNIEAFPSIKAYLEQFRPELTPRPQDLEASHDWSGRKAGSYQWFEIQDSVDYYQGFEQPKIFWPDIAKLPRFSWGEPGKFIGNTGYIIPDPDPALLGFLQSRVCWFAISKICQPLRLRAGLWQYRVLPQFISRLIVPNMTDAERTTLGALARTLTDEARARYALHEKVRRRLRADLGGTSTKPLNQKLTAWWTLSFTSLRAELVKVFKQDIPVRERDDWDDWLRENQAEHTRRTDAIIRDETELNTRVYALFDLTPDEIATIEESTKYRYGEV